MCKGDYGNDLTVEAARTKWKAEMDKLKIDASIPASIKDMNNLFTKAKDVQKLDAEEEFMLKELNSNEDYLDIRNYMFWDNVHPTSFLHLNIARAFDTSIKSLNIKYSRNTKPLEMLKCEDFNDHVYFNKTNDIRQKPKFSDLPNNRNAIGEDDFNQGSPIERVT